MGCLARLVLGLDSFDNTPHREMSDQTTSEPQLPSATCSRGFVLRAMKWILHPAGRGTISDFTTEIEVDDEGVGEFLVIRQPYAHAKLSAGGIAIDPSEWPALRDAIEAAFREIRAADSSDPIEG